MKTQRRLERELRRLEFIKEHSSLIPDFKQMAYEARKSGLYKPSTVIGDIERSFIKTWRKESNRVKKANK